ncbi:MAG: MFS transporter [Actinobacteria bacterium]|nr:MAG: MFS transporter [Actinomycetota bacterium]
MVGFLLGAGSMFAVTYSTQAILPQLGRAFHVSPAHAGLTISVVVFALACGAWIWGPFSDRYGRKRSIVLASALLVAPTVGAALAPSFDVLLAFRTLQGLCIPGLLTAGVPYVAEAFAPGIGGRAMGYYVASLVAGGLIGRVGVALVAAGIGWRWGIGLLAILPLSAAVLMQRSLVDLPIATAQVGTFQGAPSAASRTSSTGSSDPRSVSAPPRAVSSSSCGSLGPPARRSAGSRTGLAGSGLVCRHSYSQRSDWRSRCLRAFRASSWASRS